MNRTLAILVPSLLLAAAAARADDGDKPNLCEHRAVREVAKINRDLKPVKELVGIATNPTGFAIKMVDRHVVHIPKWVGIAMDPRGYVKGRAIDFVRDEVKKSVGVGHDCADEIAREEA